VLTPASSHSPSFLGPREPDPAAAACSAGASSLCRYLAECAERGSSISSFLLAGEIQRAAFTVPEREQAAAVCAEAVCTVYAAGPEGRSPSAIRSFAQLGRYLIDRHPAGPQPGGSPLTPALASRLAALAGRVFRHEIVESDHAQSNAEHEWLGAAQEIARLSKALSRRIEAREALNLAGPALGRGLRQAQLAEEDGQTVHQPVGAGAA